MSAEDEPDFTDSWSPSMWRKAMRAAEDAALNNFLAAMRFADEAERLATELAKAQGTRTAAATRVRHERAALRAAQIRHLREQGMTVAGIAKRVDMDPRSVARVLTRRNEPDLSSLS